MTVSLKLYTGESRGQTRYRDPGTSICLNCLLPQDRYCHEADYTRFSQPPTCLLALAKYHHIPLIKAEQIAEAMKLNPQRKITADRYKFELTLRKDGDKCKQQSFQDCYTK